jgi:diacylglycerol kinase (ATP)
MGTLLGGDSIAGGMKPIIEAISRRLRSFGYAFRGLGLLFRTQANARLHGSACAAVVLWGAYLRLRPSEWCLVFLCIGMVLSAEALNTAVEFLGDELSLEHRERIGRAKDVAAAAVLIACTTSLAIWAVILRRHLWHG